MAKKKKSASSSGSSRRRPSNGVVHQIRFLLILFAYLFLLVSLVSPAGSWGMWVNDELRLLVGGVTPFLAVYMLWYAGHRIKPDWIPARFVTVVGSLAFMLSLTGYLHSLVKIDGAVAAASGKGGGWLGQYLFAALSSAFGHLIAQFVLIIFLIISVMLMFDRAILPFLRAVEGEEGAVDEEHATKKNDIGEAKVQVMGEIAGTADMPKKRWGTFGKPAAAAPKASRTTIPVTPMRLSNWNYPPLTLLREVKDKPMAGNIKARMELIQKTLRDFGIEVSMTDVRIGPTVSQYTLRPADGVKLNAITARQDDLALALAAQSLRVEAPIPGKSLVGVEIPNEKKAMVGLRDILKDEEFAKIGSKLTIALGRDVAGAPASADLAKMPHVLIAGATGSGKSVCINSLILSLLMNNSPDELRMILVDPKRVELNLYNGLPHLLTPVIHEPKDTVRALGWCVREMERRYKILSSSGKRNIEQYNASPDLSEGKMPYIVLIIDELADLMMASAREVEAKIVRLAQMSRAVGIHLVVATQRPSVDVITGLIKANIPTRIAFAVTSQIDSRTIIDSTGAEKLLGYGDMLYISTDTGKPRRIQGVYCNEEEITSVVSQIRIQAPDDRYDPTVLEEPVESRFVAGGGLDDQEEALVREAYDLVLRQHKASTSMLQTHMRLGYNKAKRIITAMEERGMIGPERGGKMREVYDIDVDGGGSAYDDGFGGDGGGVDEGGIAPYPERD